MAYAPGRDKRLPAVDERLVAREAHAEIVDGRVYRTMGANEPNATKPSSQRGHADPPGAYSVTMSAAEALTLSYDEYLARERTTGLRHQYIDGVAYAMAGAEPEHASVTANAIAALATLLRGGRCRVFSSDLKLRVPESGNAYYADLAVVYGRVVRDLGDPIAVTNPALLLEVLSPTTETFDRGDKFADYQRLASVRHYLLVSVRTQRVEHYRRNDDGTWTYSAWGPGGSVELPDLGGTLAVDDLYVAESE